MDLVSIIIPCFNSQDYIEECINSALAQNYKNCEIIVIDDKSTDNSLTIIDQFGDKVNLIEHDINLGLAASLNTGILQARGEWIKRLDSDDILTSHCVKVLMGSATSTNTFYYGDYEIINAEGKHLKFFIEPNRNHVGHYQFCEILRQKHIGNADTMLYHKSIHNVVGPYNEDIRLSMDYEFMLRAVLMCDMRMKKASTLILAQYRIHPMTMRAKKAYENQKGIMTFKARRLEILGSVIKATPKYWN